LRNQISKFKLNQTGQRARVPEQVLLVRVGLGQERVQHRMDQRPLRALGREQPGQHRMDQQQEALVRPVLQEQEWRVEQERLQRDQPPQGQQALARRVQPGHHL
jgi:hypothetical protein